MEKDKYDLFNLTTGKYEDFDVSAKEYMDDIAKTVAKQSYELYQIYRAERDIVRSILKKATTKDESTD